MAKALGDYMYAVQHQQGGHLAHQVDLYEIISGKEEIQVDLYEIISKEEKETISET
jgi:hypothetical protein